MCPFVVISIQLHCMCDLYTHGFMHVNIVLKICQNVMETSDMIHVIMMSLCSMGCKNLVEENPQVINNIFHSV